MLARAGLTVFGQVREGAKHFQPSPTIACVKPHTPKWFCIGGVESRNQPLSLFWIITNSPRRGCRSVPCFAWVPKSKKYQDSKQKNIILGRTGGYFQKLFQGFETSGMTFDGLGEMFEGDSADKCGGKFPRCADGERGPPSA